MNKKATLTYYKNNQEKQNKLYLEEELKNEKKINKIYFFISFTIGCGIILLDILYNGFHIAELINVTGLIIFLTYLLIIYILLKKNIYKSYFKYLTTTIAVTLITITVICCSFKTGWSHATQTIILLLYLINIIISVYYKNPKLSIYSGVISAINYTVLFFYTSLFTRTNFAIIKNNNFIKIFLENHLIFISLLIISGFLFSMISKRFRYLLVKSLNSKEKIIKLNKENIKVKKINTLQTNYFVNLAHETRTPLTLINNYLEKYIKQKGINKDLTVIKNNTNKLNKDILNFLDYEKFKQGKILYNHDQIINFSKVLNNTIILSQDNALSKNVIINKNIKEHIYIKIDPAALDQIIINLIDNAMKQTEKNGKITISLNTNDEDIFFKINYSGIQILEDQHKYIFTSYYQISNKKQYNKGINIGLSIVKNIIDSINGIIKIKSNNNKGTEFSIILKQHKIKYDEITENISENINDHSLINTKNGFLEKIKTIVKDNKRDNILIIDDNTDLIKLLEDIFSENYNVYFANDGEEALNKLNNIPIPDLIISDIMLNGMNGIELYNNIQNMENYNDIPIIFLKAKNTLFNEIDILKMGAVDIITKPFLTDILKYKTYTILKNRKKNINKLKKSLLHILYNKKNHTTKENSKKYNFENKCIKYKISNKEKEVILFVFEGFEYKEIAQNLNVSITTIKTHIKNIYKKTEAQNKIELMNRFNNDDCSSY